MCVGVWGFAKHLSRVLLVLAASRVRERPEAGVPHRPDPRQATRSGGEQPAGGHRNAAEADVLQPDYRIFLHPGQHGHVLTLHGGGEQVHHSLPVSPRTVYRVV